VPRLRPLTEHEVPEEARVYFQKQEATYGQVLNSTGFSAYFPAMMAAAQELGAAIQQGQLPAQLMRLLNVKVASMIGCPF
jgi:hypothetical protein